MADMVPFQVLLTDDLAQRAATLKERTGAPMSEQIRRGLDEYLTRHGVPPRPLDTESLAREVSRS